MARTYSAEELLHMRDMLPFVINKLNPDIASDIIKVPEDVRSNMKSNTRSTRDSSSTSRSSHTSRLPRDSERSRSEATLAPRSPDDQEDIILFRGKLDLQSHEQKKMWLLRKRGSSDRSGQPFPAPSGFEAQKADNFKKFYAAVISPTHLRVTAGGRIVPNTRGLPHPTFMWNTEKQFFESTDGAFNHELEQQGSWQQGIRLNVADPHSPLCMMKPTSEDFFGPPLHTHSSTSAGALLDNKTSHSTITSAPGIIERPSPDNNNLTDEGNIATTEAQVKISPPSQFDLSRPFFVNGQPFYPAPPGLHVPANIPVLPLNMLGNPNTSYQSIVPQHGSVSTAPVQFPAGSFYLPPQMKRDGQYTGQPGPSTQIPGFTPPMVGPQLHAANGQSFGTLSMLPSTPLPEEPVAIMLEHQIHALQQQLRHCENQLQNNRHQIDEQHIMYQQNHVQNQIRALQSGLNLQGFQPALSSQEHYGPSMWDLGAGTMGAPHAPAANSIALANRTGNLGNDLANTADCQSNTHDKSMPENTDAVGTSISTVGVSNCKSAPVRPVLTSCKRLSAAAAMAPEFQPRSQLNIASQPGTVKAGFATTAARDDTDDVKNPSTQDKTETRVLLPKATKWSTPAQWANSALMHGPAAISNLHTVHHPTKGNHASANFQSQTGQKISRAANGMDPYLTGYPPPGMPVNSVKSSDMIYSRDLTEEELRARQLYWGKAPRDLSKGLPKFDGKDFYPPSPEKTSVSPAAKASGAGALSTQDSGGFCPSQQSSPPEFTQRNVTSTPHRELEGSEDPFRPGNGLEQTIYETAAYDGSAAPEDDLASTDSWGLTRAEEEEIFMRPARKASVFNERQSSFDNIGSAKPKSVDLSRRANHGQGQSTLLQGMLRNSPGTSTALPTGALSSTTAHGYLPQYGGCAVASLAPTTNNITALTPYSNLGKSGHLVPPLPTLVENQPLQQVSSAAKLLKKVKGKGKETLGPGFNPNNERTGPVYDGSYW